MQQVLSYNQIGLVGRWFFQNRSLTPLLTVCLLIVLPAEWSWQPEYLTLWLAIVAAAEGLRIWAVGYAGSATRTRGDVVPDLVVAGPYRWVRNPLYIANIAMYTAMGLVFGFVWLTAFIFVFSVVQYVLIVAYEEQTLSATFGHSYEQFVATVPRWLPKLGKPAQGTPHRFHLWKALRSERSTLLAIAVMLTIWRVKLALVSSLS